MAKPLWKINLKPKPFASVCADLLVLDWGIENPCFIGFGVPKAPGSAQLECQMLKMRVWRACLASMCFERVYLGDFNMTAPSPSNIPSPP